MHLAVSGQLMRMLALSAPRSRQVQPQHPRCLKAAGLLYPIPEWHLLLTIAATQHLVC